MVLKNCTACFTRRYSSTNGIPVKLFAQIFVLFVVIAGERGAEGSYFVPQDPTKSTELCTTDHVTDV